MLNKDDPSDIFYNLHQNPKFNTNPNRVKHRNELIELISQRFQLKTRDEWCDILSDTNIAYTPLNNISQAFNDQHTKDRELIQYINHSTSGNIPLIGQPVRFSEDRDINKIKSAPPVLGEHTYHVLSHELGYNDAYIGELINNNVITCNNTVSKQK